MYPSKEHMKQISSRLNISLIKVINWFNHKRRKFNIQRRFMNNINNRYHRQNAANTINFTKIQSKSIENLISNDAI